MGPQHVPFSQEDPNLEPGSSQEGLEDSLAVSATSEKNDGLDVQMSSSRFRSRVIGIYGVRSAGKTCYLATALLGATTSDYGTIILSDDDSRKVLEERWKELNRGELPAATPSELSPIRGSMILIVDSEPPNSTKEETAPDEISASGTVSNSPSPLSSDTAVPSASSFPRQVDQKPKKEKLRYPFLTHDFGGRLAERGESGLPQLTEQFRKWLEKADCLLFFLAVDQLQDSQEAQERLLEIDALLNQLVEKSPEGHTVQKPIAVLITKWDLISDLSGTREEELKKLEEFLKSQAGEIAHQVCQKIEKAGDSVRIFPVSTFGGHVDGRPIRPLKPFNLLEPLAWVFPQTDDYLYQNAQQQVCSALQRPIWKNYRRAISVLHGLRDEYGIQKGAIASRIQSQLQDLRHQSLRRTLRTGIIALGLALAASLFLSWDIDRRRFLTLSEKLQSPQPLEYSLIEKEVEDYMKSRNPWAWLCHHQRDIATLWERYKSSMVERFQTIEKLVDEARKSKGSLQDQRKRWDEILAKTAEFRNTYLNAPYENQLQGYEQEASRRMKEIDIEAFVQDVEAWDSNMREIPPPDSSFSLFQLEEAKSQFESAKQEGNKLLDGSKRFPSIPAVDKVVDKLNSTLSRIDQRLGQITELINQIKEYEKALQALVEKAGKSIEEAQRILATEREVEKLQELREKLKEVSDEIGRMTRDAPRSDEIKKLSKQLQAQGAEISKRIHEINKKISEQLWEPIQVQFKELQDQIEKKEAISEVIKSLDKLKSLVSVYSGDPDATDPEKARQVLTEAERMVDDFWWQFIQETKKKTPDAYDNLITEAKKYMEARLPENKQYIEKAKDFIRTCYMDAWRKQYGTFREQAGKIQDVKTLDKAIEEAEQVEKLLRRLRQEGMEFPNLQSQAAAVEAWIQWSEKLKSTKDHCFTIAQVQVPPEINAPIQLKFWVHRWQNRLKEEIGNTDWFKGNRPNAGPFPLNNITWGQDYYEILVRIEIDEWGPNTSAYAEWESLLKVFCKDGGTLKISVPEYGNKVVTVQLDSKTLKPPELP